MLVLVLSVIGEFSYLAFGLAVLIIRLLAAIRLTGKANQIRSGSITKVGSTREGTETAGEMTTTIVIALIALVGSAFSTIVTVFGAPALQARHDARRVLDNYREPLLAASYELQSRLYNILQLKFVESYISNDTLGKRSPAIESTLYVFAQYFGWREIIRQEVQYLRFSKDRQTREIDHLLQTIGEAFLSDKYGPQFMLWRAEQRGLGERMIVSADSKMTCLGYASFIENRSTMEKWLGPLERDLQNIQDGGRKRLIELQHELLDLVRRLDDKQKRYPSELKKV
jgi:hypothetical protein